MGMVGQQQPLFAGGMPGQMGAPPIGIGVGGGLDIFGFGSQPTPGIYVPPKAVSLVVDMYFNF